MRRRTALFSLGITFHPRFLSTVLQDYCDYDIFRAECQIGQVIVMEDARFGRMELGSCLTQDFGYLNCYR